LRLICEFRLAQGQARHRRPQSKNLQSAETREGERLSLPPHPRIAGQTSSQ